MTLYLYHPFYGIDRLRVGQAISIRFTNYTVLRICTNDKEYVIDFVAKAGTPAFQLCIHKSQAYRIYVHEEGLVI